MLQEAGKRTAEQGYKQNMQKNALLVELVNGLETLKACMAESRMLHLWEQVVGVSAKAGSVAKKYNNLAITISTLVTQAVSVGMVIWGVHRIADGTMTMGGLIGRTFWWAGNGSRWRSRASPDCKIPACPCRRSIC